jgi:hypothetical protein
LELLEVVPLQESHLIGQDPEYIYPEYFGNAAAFMYGGKFMGFLVTSEHELGLIVNAYLSNFASEKPMFVLRTANVVLDRLQEDGYDTILAPGEPISRRWLEILGFKHDSSMSERLNMETHVRCHNSH